MISKVRVDRERRWRCGSPLDGDGAERSASTVALRVSLLLRVAARSDQSPLRSARLFAVQPRSASLLCSALLCSQSAFTCHYVSTILFDLSFYTHLYIYVYIHEQRGRSQVYCARGSYTNLHFLSPYGKRIALIISTALIIIHPPTTHLFKLNYVTIYEPCWTTPTNHEPRETQLTCFVKKIQLI